MKETSKKESDTIKLICHYKERNRTEKKKTNIAITIDTVFCEQDRYAVLLPKSQIININWCKQ